MYRRFSFGIFITILLCSFAWVSADQTGFRNTSEFGEPRFAIDAVDFRTVHEDVNRIEVYYKIFYNGLSYQKTDSGYIADYQVDIVIEGDNDEQIEAITKQGTIRLKSYAETRREEDFLINVISTMYGPQDLKIRAFLRDGEGNLLGSVEEDLDRRKYWEKYPTISRVEFAQQIAPQTDSAKFVKHGYRVIPSVSKTFGGTIDSMLTFYHEVYPGRAQDQQMKLITRLYMRNKGALYVDTMEIGEVTEIIPVAKSINVASFPPGDYDLELELIGRRGKEYNEHKEEFELELTAESIFQADYKAAVDMLKYLATSDELNKLKKAETDEERLQAWEEFWALRQQGGNDRINPTKLEYFRRIRHANRYFGILNKEGWKTTRGMVYIKYGPPDEVEDYPFELGVKPYQLWLYYRINPPRKFTFVDEWGDGNYELQPPYDGIAY
ncbi:MAG: GWxTD domain-containing protein [Candidatus Zixiibacteriota bacterium]